MELSKLLKYEKLLVIMAQDIKVTKENVKAIKNDLREIKER